MEYRIHGGRSLTFFLEYIHGFALYFDVEFVCFETTHRYHRQGQAHCSTHESHLSSILTVELIDSPCPSLTAPVLCYIFYVISDNFILFFDDIFTNLIFFLLCLFSFNNS